MRTGKKSPPLSKDVVKKQLSMADTDGDLKLTMDEWLSFSRKLAKMEESMFVKTFSAYKVALVRAQEDKKKKKKKKKKKDSGGEKEKEGGEAEVGTILY